jgi:4,5-DOPA dioxygenase extradiol
LDADRDCATAVASTDHLILALGPEGPAGAECTPGSDVLVDGSAPGSLSTTAYTPGLTCPDTSADGGSPRRPGGPPPDGCDLEVRLVIFSMQSFTRLGVIR